MAKVSKGLTTLPMSAESKGGVLPDVSLDGMHKRSRGIKKIQSDHVEGTRSMNAEKKNLPFVSDNLVVLSHFTNNFHNESHFFINEWEVGYFRIENLPDFVKDLVSKLKDLGYELELFRDRQSPPRFISEKGKHLFYLRGEGLYLCITLTGSPVESWYSEKEVEEALNSWEVELKFLGDQKIFLAVKKEIMSLPTYARPRQQDVYDININEFFIDGGEMKHTENNMTTLDFEDVLLSMYPGINMREFLNSYIESDENIAIFVGRPGTGKTSLLKLILRECALLEQDDIHAVYVKDPKVLHRSAFWSMMSRHRACQFLILDDLDHELLPRDSVEFKEYQAELEKANSLQVLDAESKSLDVSRKKAEQTIVNQLLSFSDGLFQSSTKVLITTNLETTRIDPAIIRPGRCFDILKFPYMTLEHALRVWVEDFKLSKEQFDACFEDALTGSGPAISQSLLASEAKQIQRNRLKSGYLEDKTISVRNKYM